MAVSYRPVSYVRVGRCRALVVGLYGARRWVLGGTAAGQTKGTAALRHVSYHTYRAVLSDLH